MKQARYEIMAAINKLILTLTYFVNILKGSTLVNESVVLTSVNGSVGDLFGASTAMNNDFIVVGTFKDNVDGKESMGSVSVFSRHGVECTFRQKLIPYDGAERDFFGLSVALSEGFLLVGSLRDSIPIHAPSRGSVYFYAYKDGDWVFQQKVFPNDVASSVQFGISIAIDGKTAAVAGGCAHAQGDDVAALHIFNYNGTSWAHTQLLKMPDVSFDNTFGTSVALVDDFVALGLSYVKINGSDYAGVVYLYKKKNGTWQQHTTLISSTPTKLGWFGRSISMYGNRLVIGAEGENKNKGNVYVYVYRRDVWELEANLTASDERNKYHFGFAVSIDRQTILVGSFKSDGDKRHVGVPYVFKLVNNETWVDHVHLVENGVVGYDLFGRSLALYNDTVVVGVYDHGLDNGSAYIFRIPPLKVTDYIHHNEQFYTDEKSERDVTGHETRGHHYSLLVIILVPSLIFFIILAVAVKVKCKRTRRIEHTFEGEILAEVEYIEDTGDNTLLINDPVT